MRVVVTGGQGALGSQVMTHLRELGHEAVSASRRSGVDLRTGAGLDAAIAGADAIVHTADTTNPRLYAAVTVGGTRQVLEAAARQHTPPHVVTISIVGVAHHPYAYYRAKRAAEVLVEQSGLPATVVAATQFHSLAAFFARRDSRSGCFRNPRDADPAGRHEVGGPPTGRDRGRSSARRTEPRP